MPAIQLDHVNIRTRRMAETIAFYRDVLGMVVKPPPMTDDILKGAFVYDPAGHAIFHLVATDKFVEGPEPVSGAAQRGLVDHVALQCSDLEPFMANIRERNIEHKEVDVPQLKLHLVFLRDPNGVMIELNFPM